ncbi:hypothetical protein [Nocardioides terrisoli]|uniref:hypothetical protein n=1 Tax=Nocardioides terrisoli TaxID=3388267 RepID=UPI00287B8693|nr:hypothetical protein [Nocardioides marmorisolisilvae]
MRFLRTVTFLVVVAVVVGVGFAIWRGAGPLPNPEGCSATVAGHHVAVDTGQGEIASLIAAVGVRRGLPARAVSIALATGFQESKLRNLPGGDRDSVGVFQQRPSQGWGSRAQIRNPVYAINAFYDALQKVHGYQTMQITVAAQRVQRSGYPDAYAEHAPDARALASALTGYSPGGRFSCVVHDSQAHGTAVAVTDSITGAFGPIPTARGPRQDVTVAIPAGPAGRRTGWAVAQYVVAHAKRLHVQEISFDHRHWQIGRASEKGWTRARAAVPTRVVVSLG